MTTDYIVYIAELDGEILYVGSGKANRYKHCTSGTSHVYGLNKLHFDGRSVTVRILKDGLTKENSLLVEKDMIRELNPKFNVCNTAMDTRLTSSAALLSVRNKALKIISENSQIRFRDYAISLVIELISKYGLSNMLQGVSLSTNLYHIKRGLKTKSKNSRYFALKEVLYFDEAVGKLFIKKALTNEKQE